MIEVRVLPQEAVALLREIDRSEHIETLYETEDGVLTSRSVSIDVPPWDPEGTGTHSVARLVGFVEPVLERGGTLLAAYVDGRIAGIAVVDARFEENMAWLTLLHVGRPFRRRGVATALWDAAVDGARAAGARSIYVSATPSGSAVGFYLSRGCRVLVHPHPGLLAMEPEDIHLLAAVEPSPS